MNHREHFRVRAKRVKAERESTAWVLTRQPKPTLPCTVHFTRVAPSEGLDCDSLPASCKGIRDQIAQWIGVDDRDSRIKWEYGQVRGKEFSVEVEIHG